MKSVHPPRQAGRGWAGKYLERVHIDITGDIAVASGGGREYVCVVVGDHTREVYTRPLRFKSEVVEAFEAFEAFRAAVENDSGRRMLRS